MATNDEIPDPLGSDAPPTHQQPLPAVSRPLSLIPPPRPKYDAAAATPDPADIDDEVPQSQPMTATHSHSSQNGDGDASAPYGTRSRNRGPRINYADDKELDLEIEATGRITKANSRRAAAAAKDSYLNSATPTNGFSVINAAPISNGDHAPAQKDVAVPAQSQASVPAPAPSKKRKQPPVSSANASGTTTPYALGPRVSAQPAHYVVSNVMSFAKSEARLNAKGQLVADDGTTLAANGKTPHSCPNTCADLR
jgi:hypothetical protein